MSRRAITLLAVTAALVASGGILWRRSEARVAAPTPAATSAAQPATDQPAVAQAVATATAVPEEVKLPPAFYRKLPPNSRVRLRLPAGLKDGLRCPDGTFLPLLNGVPNAYPLKRPARNGPLPPVVAKVTDSGGYEWYEHADGSHTTTRFEPMTDADGQTRLEVVTTHHAPMDPGFGQAPPVGPIVDPVDPQK